MNTLSQSVLSKPLLIVSFADTWPCRSWTFQTLAATLEDQMFACRIALKSCGQRMETQCVHKDVTVKQFCDWLDEKADINNPLSEFNRAENSCYIDYKHMKDMFSDHPEIFDQVQWKDFGLNGFDGYDSTIWLGSEGANTPGHQDSYGFNLVTQLCGRKLWILFPPEDSEYLYPTRVPYEESSVFTQVNIRKPDFKSHPRFKLSHPVVVTLSPGQTLYVPRHWWHYVESLEPSISVNVWVPLKEDRESRLHEAITRCLATSLITTLDTSDDSTLQSKWLNPTEDLAPANLNLLLLKTALCQLLDDSVDSKRSPRRDGSQRTHTEERKEEETPEKVRGVDQSSNDGNRSVSALGSEAVVQRHKFKMETETYKDVKNSCQTPSYDALKLHQAAAVADESYLSLFAESMKGNKCISVSSPFQYDTDEAKWSLTSKRKQDSQHGFNYKRWKCEYTSSTALSHTLSPVSDSVTNTGTDCKLFLLYPCSIDLYVNFLDNLCELITCSQCHGSLRNTEKRKSHDRQKTAENDCFAFCRSDVLLAREMGTSENDAAVCSTDEEIGSGSRFTSPKLTFAGDGRNVKSMSGGQSSNKNDSRGEKSESVTAEEKLDVSEELDQVFSQLSLSEISETLLTCALHPDVVDKISMLFREQCELRLKQKFK